MDVHCCNCHSGFVFDRYHICEPTEGDRDATNEIPRRAQIQQWTPAEKAIYDAMQAVESMAADVRLTDAVTLLGAAMDSVADYIDAVQKRRYVRCEDAEVDHAPTVPVIAERETEK